jgi:glycosyltransferase involved in cell wall biosynthesis
MQPTVVYIITKLELGGAQKVCLSLFHHLPEQHIKTILISGNEGSLAPSVKDHKQVILLESFKREVSLSLLFAEFKTFIQLIRQLRSLKKQHTSLIVHTHSTKAGLVGRWAAFFAGVKTRVHTIHGYAFHNHQSRFIWTAIYFLELLTSFITTHFVCVSGADVKMGKKLFPRFAQKHSVIRAAVDAQLFSTDHAQAFPESGKPFVFGSVSCHKRQKNLPDLIRAFAFVHSKNSNTRLEIIGDGVGRAALETLIQELNISHAVTLHGWKSDVTQTMKAWHAFTLSSLWEGLPCAVVEARLMKLPVLSYHTGGIYEVVRPGINGFLYKQKDWQSLGQGMLTLSLDPQLHQRLRSSTDTLAEFHEERMIEQHRNLYVNIG